MDSGLLIGGLGFAVTILLIFLEIPVGIAMGLVGLLGCWYYVPLNAVTTVAGNAVWYSLTNYTLTVIPLFVLMGNFATASGLSQRLYGAMRAFIGHRAGGLSLATILTSASFGMLSGSSMATTATMGQVALSEMRKAGYAPGAAGGAIAAGGTLGILIPPSTILIIYGFLAEQSIRDLFLAAMVPGALAVVMYLLAVALPPLLGWQEPSPREPRADGRARVRALGDLAPALMIFFLVMGGLYGGIFTTNEAAAAGVAITLGYAVVTRSMGWRAFGDAVLSSVATTATLYVVLIGSTIFNAFLTFSGLPFSLTAALTAITSDPVTMILLMLGVYLLLGTLMDSLAMMLLTVPLFVPVAQALGIDLVWFGIFVVMVVEIGLITPPVGMNLFVIKAISADLRMVDLWRGVTPFVVADLIRVTLLIAVPALALWLPAHAN